MKVFLSTNKAPAAIGPYSQGIRCGNTVWLSGQLGVDPASGDLKDGVEDQTRQAFANIGAILVAAGLEFADIVKTTVFLKNMDDFARMNAVYATVFQEPFPARSTIEVARLPKDALVEIEVVAVKTPA